MRYNANSFMKRRTKTLLCIPMYVWAVLFVGMPLLYIVGVSFLRRGASWGVTDEIRRKRAAGLAEDDRKSAVRRSHQNSDVQRLYSEFLGKPLSDKAHSLLQTSYTPRKQYQR